ncbi:MAG: glycosyltransferase [candidate division Zixibacteria bacterium]|nr:glycosyltransferase [candidate division Zixibacteria bacterium]
MAAAARLRLQAGDAPGALECVRAVMRLAPHDPDALAVAGEVAAAAGLEAEAEALLQRALAADPMLGSAHRGLCDLWGRVLARLAPDLRRKRDLLRTLHWLSRYAPDCAAAPLLRENLRLREEALAAGRNRWVHADTRILLHLPPPGALRSLIENWAEVLAYGGIPARLLRREDPTEPVFEQFRPDVFITLAEPAAQVGLDRDYIGRYRRAHGLRVGHLTSFRHEYPPCDFLIALGCPADLPRADGAETPLLDMPPAINPLRHYMRPRAEVWDYAFVGDNTPQTVERVKACLLPVLRLYSGVLAGRGWDIGLGELHQAEEAVLFNFARVCPNLPLPGPSWESFAANLRALAIPACGGFALTDNTAFGGAFFAPDETAAADSPGRFVEMFDYFRNHPDQRLPIIRAGMERVYREHTLFHRMDLLLAFLGCRGGSLRRERQPVPPWEESATRPVTWADRLT